MPEPHTIYLFGFGGKTLATSHTFLRVSPCFFVFLRVPFIGVPRAVLDARGAQRRRGTVSGPQREDGSRRDDFYPMQLLGGGRAVRAA